MEKEYGMWQSVTKWKFSGDLIRSDMKILVFGIFKIMDVIGRALALQLKKATLTRRFTTETDLFKV